MSKKLLTNSIYYTLGKMLPMAVAFIMVPIYTSYLAPSDYGIVNSMKALSNIVAIIFSLSIETSLFRLFYEYKDEKSQKVFIGTAFVLIILSSFIGTILLFLCSDYLVLIYRDISFSPFYIITIIAMFVGMFQIVPRIIFIITERGKSYFFVGLLNLGVALILNVIYIIILDDKAIGVLKALMLTNIIMLPVYLYYQIRYSKITIDLSMIPQILKFSIPLLPASLSGWIMTSSSRIFIDKFFSQAEVGIFSLGFRITFVFIMLVTSIRLAYNPIYFRLANDNDKVGASHKLISYNHYYFLISILACFFISFFARETIGLFLNANYFDSWKILVILTYSYLFLESSAIFRMGLYQTKNTMFVTIIVIVSAVLNLLLNWLLISKWSIYGAAFSNLLSSIFVFITFYFVSKKWAFFVKMKWSPLLIIFSSGVVINVLFWLSNLEIIKSMLIKLCITICLFFVIYKVYKVEINKIFTLYFKKS